MAPKKGLSSGQRIRQQTTFKHLVETGRFARGEFFYLWVSRQEKAPGGKTTKRPMVAVVVSRKTDARAVGRNSWKRRAKEIFREQQERLHPDAVCLIKVRPNPGIATFAAAQEDLIKLFKKAGAWV